MVGDDVGDNVGINVGDLVGYIVGLSVGLVLGGTDWQMSPESQLGRTSTFYNDWILFNDANT